MAEGTGADFGLRGIDQIRIVAAYLREHGEARISELYEAVEDRLNGNTLSAMGKSSLRFFVNSVAVDRGYIQAFDAEHPGWRLTPLGARFAAGELDEPELTGTELNLAGGSGEQAWLFQFNPDRYDLAADLGAGLRQIQWAMNQSFRQVQEGDRVYLYRSGQNAGVTATATVVSDGAYALPSADDFGQWKVDLIVTSIVTPVLDRAEMRGDSILASLDVFKFAAASNYRLSAEQAVRMEELLGSRLQPLDAEPTVAAAVKLVSDRRELEAFEAEFRARFMEGGIPASVSSIGFRGGQVDGTRVIWHERLQLWGCIDELDPPEEDRFWNAFGTQNPSRGTAPTIVSEVNPAREGVNARTAGAFAVNPENGHRLLLHRGRIGGGRAGIGAELFWSNTELPAVAVIDDPTQRFVLVADLDEPDVPAQVSRFVREVERVKALATSPPTQTQAPLVSGKYAPLAEWLQQQQGDEARTTFGHIESLVGPLPMSARKYPVFWTGTAMGSPTHSQKKAWEAAGFKVAAYSFPDETVTFARQASPADPHPEAVARTPRYWWVNQGQTYERELAGGYIWAPMRARNGVELSFHRAVSQVTEGDFVIHYQRGIRAVSRVTEAPVFAPKPAELTEDDWENEGRLAKVEYSTFDPVLPLERIPVPWRIEEGGPFSSQGTVNQGYLYPLSAAFVRRLSGLFSELADALGVEPTEDATSAHTPDVVDDLAIIAASVADEGLVIDERTLRRFHLSLRTRGFVILSGTSGTGKTWLAEAYGRAVHGEQLLVPVAPNWNTNEDLLGYLNPIDGVYYDTKFSLFVRAAAAEWEDAVQARRPARPFFLILDEMNLARVEYYFAQFLSALEVRERRDVGTLYLGKEEVALGRNLRFIGTVNVDETTHAFADKVYDRAQLIELSASREALAKHLGDAAHADALLAVWDIVHGVAPFAFRVLDDIATYIAAAAELDVPWHEALDEQLLQKVLPKVKGLDPRAGQTLEHFVAWAEGGFPLSRAKALEMLEGYNEHGAVSFFA